MADPKVFEAMLARGQDNALLRYSLGNAYQAKSDFENAVKHLRAAIEHDPQYSAAWKSLGRCYLDSGSFEEAIDCYRSGITVAQNNGDKQAVKEMQVFLKRAERKAGKNSAE